MRAIKLQQLACKLYSHHIPIIPGLIRRWIHFRFSSDISPITRIGQGTMLGHGGIGVVINKNSVIGRNCILAQNVTLAGKDGGCPVLHDWVYVGANSVILGGVDIGDNVFVGALSLVNKSIPPNSVVCGIPAKVLRIRTESEIEEWHKWVVSQGGIEFEKE